MAVINDKNIVNDKQEEVVLKGIQPRHQFAFRIFKICRAFGIGLIVFAALLFGLSFIKAGQFITGHWLYRRAVLYMLIGAGGFFLFMLFIRITLLRRAPFDDWVFEIAQKRLGTEVIFYDSKYIYIDYDRSGKEVDKREFVTEMSDKSVHFSYFYIKTYIDRGIIQIECKKRAPIPKMASFSENDDLYWNIIPLGLCINSNTQSVSPVGWYLNDKNKNPQMLETVPSTSILICGGTGCHGKDEIIPIYNTLEK